MTEKMNAIESCAQGYTQLNEEVKNFIRGYIAGKLDACKNKGGDNGPVKKSA